MTPELDADAERLSASAVAAALRSAFVFPKTKSVEESFGKAVVQVLQEQLDFGALEAHIRSNQDVVDIKQRANVLHVLTRVQALEPWKLNLHRMDGFIFYFRGLDVLAVRLSSNNSGRCAFIDMEVYHNMLVALASTFHSKLAITLQEAFQAAFVFALTTGAMTTAFSLVSRL